MSNATPTLTPDEAADLLQELLEKDLAIEDLQRQLLKAKTAYNLVKEELADAEEARSKLSYEIRNPPPLFSKDGNGNPHGPRRDGPMSPEQVNAEVVAGVREAEASRGYAPPSDIDVPLDPASLPKLPTALGLPKPATPLGGKAKRGRKRKLVDVDGGGF